MSEATSLIPLVSGEMEQDIFRPNMSMILVLPIQTRQDLEVPSLVIKSHK